jgi:hypothetical protein
VNSKEKALQIEMKIRDDRKGAAVFRRTGTVQRIYGLQKGKKRRVNYNGSTHGNASISISNMKIPKRMGPGQDMVYRVR